MTAAEKKSQRMRNTGFILVVSSYILYAPIFLFVSMCAGGNTALWGRLAGATYILSWAVFLLGILMAGPSVARSARLWLVKLFKRPQTETVTELND